MMRDKDLLGPIKKTPSTVLCLLWIYYKSLSNSIPVFSIGGLFHNKPNFYPNRKWPHTRSHEMVLRGSLVQITSWMISLWWYPRLCCWLPYEGKRTLSIESPRASCGRGFIINSKQTLQLNTLHVYTHVHILYAVVTHYRPTQDTTGKSCNSTSMLYNIW